MPSISPRHALTSAEKEFVRIYLSLENAAEAYRRAFPSDAKGHESRTHSDRGMGIIKQPHIQRFIEWTQSPAEEVASQIEAEEMLFGDKESAAKAADKSLGRDKKKDATKTAIDVWASQVLSRAVAQRVEDDGTVVEEPTAPIFGFTQEIESEEEED